MNKPNPKQIELLFQVAGLSGWFTLNALDSIACKLEKHHTTIFKNLIGVNDPSQTSSEDTLNSYWCIISAPIAHFVLTAYFLAQTIHYFGIAAWEGDSEYLNTALTCFLTAILSAILIAPSFFINFVNSICRESQTDSQEINVNLKFNEIVSTDPVAVRADPVAVRADPVAVRADPAESSVLAFFACFLNTFNAFLMWLFSKIYGSMVAPQVYQAGDRALSASSPVF